MKKIIIKNNKQVKFETVTEYIERGGVIQKIKYRKSRSRKILILKIKQTPAAMQDAA